MSAKRGTFWQILFLLFTLGLPLQESFSYTACDKQLQAIFDLRKKEIVTNVVDKMQDLVGTAAVGISPSRMQKMDEFFLQELQNKLGQLNPIELERFNRVVMSASRFLRVDATYAYVDNISHPERMALLVNELLVKHPSSRVMLWHEFDHIIEGIIGVSGMSGTRKYEYLENSAAAAHYDFINQFFDHEDVLEIKKSLLMTFPNDLLSRMRSRGLMKKNSERVIMKKRIFKKFKQDEDFRRDYIHYQAIELNQFFIEEMERALSVNRQEYTEQWLIRYRSEWSARNELNGSLAVGGIVIWFQLLEIWNLITGM